MPKKEAEKTLRVDELVDRLCGGTLAFSDKNIFEENYIENVIDGIPDQILEKESSREFFCKRIKFAREGIYPKGTKLSLRAAGKNLGISAAAMHKKEASVSKIDRNDLRAFCYLYGVMPLYLAGLSENPDESRVSVFSEPSLCNFQ